MANGNDKSNLIQNMAKISYGVAGLLGLVILLIPIFAGGELKDLMASVTANRQKLEEKSPDFPTEPIPQIKEKIREQWMLNKTEYVPTWSTERKQSHVLWVEVAPDTPLIHETPPEITRIEYRRVPYKTYLKIHGKFGTLNLEDKGEFASVSLLRKTGETGEENFVPVKGFDAATALNSRNIECDDFDVKPGLNYAYKVETTIRPRPSAENVIIHEGDKSASSNELATNTPVPHDYSLNIIQATDFDPESQKDAFFFGGIEFADFKDESKTIKISNGEHPQGTGFGPEIKLRGKTRRLFKIQSIETGSKSTVHIRHALTTKKEPLTTKENGRNVMLPPPVVPPDPIKESDEEGFDIEAVDTPAVDEKKVEEEPKKTAPKKASKSKSKKKKSKPKSKSKKKKKKKGFK